MKWDALKIINLLELFGFYLFRSPAQAFKLKPQYSLLLTRSFYYLVNKSKDYKQQGPLTQTGNKTYQGKKSNEVKDNEISDYTSPVLDHDNDEDGSLSITSIFTNLLKERLYLYKR